MSLKTSGCPRTEIKNEAKMIQEHAVSFDYNSDETNYSIPNNLEAVTNPNRQKTCKLQPKGRVYTYVPLSINEYVT
jgi:hypothetical protein